ncbi:NPL4 family-domain-containing protein [Zopfochytrium polystomum]|nr:NPL4 family-domain-containing protein [Zopfochytrium polystomum]
MVATALKYPAGSSFSLSTDPKGKDLLSRGALTLKHGDMLFVTPQSSEMDVDDEAAPAKPAAAKSSVFVKQDPLDDYLEKQKGTIKRQRDPNFCRHGPSGMCDYCMPLEPYDPKYIEQNKIKHISYHAYLRQVCNTNKTAPPTSPAFLPPLDEPVLKVIHPCPSRTHGPYPAGICTKCQPSAITLTSQGFRMVDHVEFASASVVENFISFWRSTGCQRFGLMYGRYEHYPEVPLGVRAVVEAIYEPPQNSAPDAIQLEIPNPQQKAALGLQLVGMAYLDLMDDGTGTGSVVCKRHANSYFLSSAECILSAEYQARHPVTTRYSSTSQFGSRFVTCVISGNESSQIDIACYQVSNMGVAMVKDGIIEASVDPSLMRVKASSPEQYIPEVFYKYKNEYGLMVKEPAKPTFPVDYLLVTLSHGFPQQPHPMFIATQQFPIENRLLMFDQAGADMSALHRHLTSDPSVPLATTLSDFHLVLFLKEAQILEDVDMIRVGAVAKGAAKAKEEKQALAAGGSSGSGGSSSSSKSSAAYDDTVERELTALVSGGGWQTLTMIARESGESAGKGKTAAAGGSSGGGGGSSSKGPWTCRHCTFVNISGRDCEVCGATCR